MGLDHSFEGLPHYSEGFDHSFEGLPHYSEGFAQHSALLAQHAAGLSQHSPELAQHSAEPAQHSEEPAIPPSEALAPSLLERDYSNNPPIGNYTELSAPLDKSMFHNAVAPLPSG